MSSALRILMTCDAVGGVWQYSLDLCRSLAAQGAEICLVVLGPPAGPRQRAAAEAIEGLAFVEVNGELDWTASHAGQIEDAAEQIVRLATIHDADIVHLNSPALAAEVRFPGRVVAVAHSCVGTWWDAVRGGPLPEDLAWRDRLHAAGLRAADLAVAPSASFAAATAERHRLRQPPRAIHNGRSALPVVPRAMHDFVFTAGRLWDEGKDVATLDRAAGQLAIPFRAAGACVGPNGEGVRLDEITVLGQLDESGLARELACRPVFASAARYEPFGLAVLEAATAGCPLILSDIATFRELWDGVACFVAPGDDGGFAEAIDGLIGDSRRRIELGEAARMRARRYSSPAMGEATMAAYRQLLSIPRAEGRMRAVA